MATEIKTTAVAMAGGVDAIAEVREKLTVTVGGTWSVDDRFSILLTSSDGAQFRFGESEITGLVPAFAITFRDKVYVACGDTLAFSSIGNPRRFADTQMVAGEDADEPGNGYIVPGNNYGTPDTIQALALYQGRMAVFNRNSVQLWEMQADPAGNAQEQVLENVGTLAPLTPKPLGTLDVMFLSESGMRSLRVRDSSNNAIVVDIGTPIDSLVQADLAALSEEEKSAACAVVEPSANRYWCFVPQPGGGNGAIYVLSYFPTANIAAWSVYRPTYRHGSTNATFVPQKFVVRDGRVYARTANGLVRYGGHSGVQYDNCGVTLETPWLDARTPANRKHAKAVDVAAQGAWQVSLGMDPISGILETCYSRSDADNASSFTLGQVAVQMQGTHFKLKAVESGAGYARFSSAAFHYQPGEAS